MNCWISSLPSPSSLGRLSQLPFSILDGRCADINDMLCPKGHFCTETKIGVIGLGKASWLVVQDSYIGLTDLFSDYNPHSFTLDGFRTRVFA
jgi:hypothetical protein